MDFIPESIRNLSMQFYKKNRETPLQWLQSMSVPAYVPPLPYIRPSGRPAPAMQETNIFPEAENPQNRRYKWSEDT